MVFYYAVLLVVGVVDMKGWFDRHSVFCNVVLLVGGVFLTVGLLYLAFFGLGEFVVWLGGLF